MNALDRGQQENGGFNTPAGQGQMRAGRCDASDRAGSQVSHGMSQWHVAGLGYPRWRESNKRRK